MAVQSFARANSMRPGFDFRHWNFAAFFPCVWPLARFLAGFCFTVRRVALIDAAQPNADFLLT